MQDNDNLNEWFLRQNFCEQAKSIIKLIRTSNPSRHVQSRKNNVSGRYPSKKMGMMVQFESHLNELAFIYQYEYDPNVLEYYDQPNQIKLSYKTKDGRLVGALHTPDFFVIRNNSVGWEECKTEEDLIKLSHKSPNRYVCSNNGQWHCPPGEVYAQQYGFYYRLCSSKEINWVKQRNLLFLEDYIRYELQINSNIKKQIQAIIIEQQGIKLKELVYRIEQIASLDQIYSLIINGEIYVDLDLLPITESERIRVFSNKNVAISYTEPLEVSTNNLLQNQNIIDISIGMAITWDGKLWKIVNVGSTMISLLGNNYAFTEIPIAVFEALTKEGKITGFSINENDNSSRIASLLMQASLQDLSEANRRNEIVCKFLSGELLNENKIVAERTLHRWVASYRKAKKVYGNGFIGLLPKTRQRGFRGPKLPEQTHQLMAEFIEKDYETNKQKRKYEVWAALKLTCDNEGIVCPSYKTFCRVISERNSYNQTFKRQGHRGAYKKEPFYWELEFKIPRHGDRPLEICHIDHTEMDIELVCSRTSRNLGRPWATFLTDAYSRRILAFFITFDPPSYRSCMMVLRECVRLHSRLPQIIVVDGGQEFKSIYFDTLLARYECTKKVRPSSKARFGSVCERLFGTTNTQFIYNLQGNTQITKNIRQLTKSVDPKRQAIWTLERFYERLREYVYSVYDVNSPYAGGRNTVE